MILLLSLIHIYPDLSITEKMILQVMNKRTPAIQREKDKDIFQNFNDEEIKIFAQKIQRILQTV